MVKDQHPTQMNVSETPTLQRPATFPVPERVVPRQQQVYLDNTQNQFSYVHEDSLQNHQHQFIEDSQPSFIRDQQQQPDLYGIQERPSYRKQKPQQILIQQRHQQHAVDNNDFDVDDEEEEEGSPTQGVAKQRRTKSPRKQKDPNAPSAPMLEFIFE